MSCHSVDPWRGVGGFPIPMRGNEFIAFHVRPVGFKVSDPHEG